MEIGLGVLHLSPSVFWNEYTVPELMAAIDGYVESQGGKRDDDTGDLTDDDRDKLNVMMARAKTSADTPEQRKKTLAIVKKMAADKRAQEAKQTKHANRSR